MSNKDGEVNDNLTVIYGAHTLSTYSSIHLSQSYQQTSIYYTITTVYFALPLYTHIPSFTDKTHIYSTPD